MLLILCAVVAYAPAIGAGYIWDDDILLAANPQMQSAHGIAEIWQGKNSRDYTPVTLTSFWLEWQMWGNSAVGYHVGNILLHALSVVLLWRILVMLGIPGAWLAALLFAIHPLNVASVAWIAELKNTLSGAFFFASILGFLHARKTGGRRFYIASIIFFLLAGLSKGAVVTLPLVLVGCILWTDRKITRRDLLPLVPFAVIAAAVSLLTIRYQSRAVDYGLLPAGLPYRIARAGMMMWRYPGEIFLPTGLSPMSPQWFPDLHSPFTWMPVCGVVLVIALFFLKRKSWGRPLLFASGYYLWMLLPVLGFIWMALLQETPSADWWQYLAAPGIFACVAAGFTVLLKRSVSTNVRHGLHALLGIVLALLFMQTWRRCAIYESMETYCRAVIAENPHAWSMQNNLGIVLKQRGDLPAAIGCYRQALIDNPRFMEAHNNLGNALAASDKLPEAEAEFRAALLLRPGSSETLANLADVCFKQGKVVEAYATQAEAIKADRYNPARYTQFGMMFVANKQFDQAATCFKNALTLAPGDITTQLNLVRSLLAAGHRREATAACEEAMQTALKSRDGKLIGMVASLLSQCRRP